MKILHNVHIYTDSKIHEGHLLLQNGKIQQLGSGSPDAIILDRAEEKIDGKGGLLLPGFIDVHTHFRDLNQTHKETVETGSKAAIAGGVTTVMAMPNTQPPLSTPETVESYYNLQRSLFCNIGLFANVTEGFTLDAVDRFKTMGIFGLKVYPGGKSAALPLEWADIWKTRGNPDRILSDIDKMASTKEDDGPTWQTLFAKAKSVNLPLLFHPELPFSAAELKNKQNSIVKEEQSYRLVKNPHLYAHNSVHPIQGNELAILQMIGTFLKRYHPDPATAPQIHICHVSCAASIVFLTALKKQGYPLSFEVTPHHMFLNYSGHFPIENYAKVLNPLRSPIEQQKVWEKVQEGKIDIIATDHAPHSLEEKSKDFESAPSGFPGIDVAARLLLTQVFDFQLAMDKFVNYYSTRPAQLFGLKNKGKISPGFDADLVIIEKTHPIPLEAKDSPSLAKWSPYEGMKVKAKIAMVFVGGEQVYDGEKGFFKPKGQFIRRS